MRKPFIFLGIAGVLIFAWTIYLWCKPAPQFPPRRSPSPQTKPPERPAVASPGISGTAPASATAPAVGDNPDGGAASRPPQASPDGQPAPGLVARVNGEPIYQEDVTSGIDPNRFGLMIKDAKRTRLDRLISIIAVRQHLKAQGIEVPDKEVETEVENLKRNPPAAGCSCCRYGSLDEFLASCLMTMSDLRESIRNDIGLNKHVAAMWNNDYPAGEKRDALLSKERQRIEQGYMKISHVFFNTAQQPDFQADPDGVRDKAKKKATSAWQRLRKGEDFGKVARDRSEDTFSRPKGGDLGCIPKTVFGKDVEATVQQLKPGAYSPPVESPWGVHIIRRDSIGDQDILDALQAEYKDKKLQEVYASVQEHAKVERFDGDAKRR